MTEPDKDPPSAAAAEASENRDPTPKKRPKVLRWLVLAVLVCVGVAYAGVRERSSDDAKLQTWTNARAIPAVNLISPRRATETEKLVLPADVEAFYTAPIHSRVNGYVKMWHFDIGARVKVGDVLATIDTPELDQQYTQVKGELSKAMADYDLAKLTADRWKGLRASQAVSQQTVDEKVGDEAARKAQVAAARANVDRVRAMEDFKNILAPFDGVVTKRRIDVGALVSATNQNASPLYEVAQVDKMRVYVSVPQASAASMHKGLEVTLTLPQYPARKFEGVVDTTSDAISAQSRALLVEAIFDNAAGLLTPGSYAEAYFRLPLDPHKLVIPSSAMMFRDLEPEVAVVRNDTIAFKPIKILVDMGATIEVGSGLDLADKIVQSPSDSMEDGDKVKVVSIDGKRVEAKPDRPKPSSQDDSTGHEANGHEANGHETKGHEAKR